MHTLCWSAKGGCGTTVVAAALALLSARQAPTLLLDLGGDQPSALGMADPGEPGVGDWLASSRAAAESLWQLSVEAVDGLRVVPLGTPATFDQAAWSRLVGALASAPGPVIVDAGNGPPPPSVHQRVTRSLLVLRPCYLAVRRAVAARGLADGVVLVTEPARALGVGDVEHTVGASVMAEVAWDPAVARAVDSGLLASRLPSAIARPLQRLVLPGVAA